MLQIIEEREVSGMKYEELDIVFVSEGAQYEEIDLEALDETHQLEESESITD